MQRYLLGLSCFLAAFANGNSLKKDNVLLRFKEERGKKGDFEHGLLDAEPDNQLELSGLSKEARGVHHHSVSTGADHYLLPSPKIVNSSMIGTYASAISDLGKMYELTDATHGRKATAMAAVDDEEEHRQRQLRGGADSRRAELLNDERGPSSAFWKTKGDFEERRLHQNGQHNVERRLLVWNKGDVFAGVGNGNYNVFSNNGTFKETIPNGVGGTTTGCAFNNDKSKLYTTDFDNEKIVVFDAAHPHTLLQTIDTSPGVALESIVFDAAGNFYVGHAGVQDVPSDTKIRKYDAAGTLLESYSAATDNRGTDWIDLASDQCTLYYTSEGRLVKRFDVCNNKQLSDFATLPGSGVAYALRLLPPGDGTGGLLVADTFDIKRLNSAGTVVKTYDTDAAADEDGWFALNLDPFGTSFWSGGVTTKNFYRFNIETADAVGKPVGGPYPSGGTGSELGGLCLLGEVTAAQEVYQITLTPTTATVTLPNAHTLTIGTNQIVGDVVTPKPSTPVVLTMISGGPEAPNTLLFTGSTGRSGTTTFVYNPGTAFPDWQGGKVTFNVCLERAPTVCDEATAIFKLPKQGTCGDGRVDPGEQCDDGNAVSNDGCSRKCRREFCGDGILQTGLGEECDDGNNISGDGCSSTCKLVDESGATCGNGRLDLNEQCDDGNKVSNDGCSSRCRIEACGDGITQTTEQCDDGNSINGDGCSSICRIEKPGRNNDVVYLELLTPEQCATKIVTANACNCTNYKEVIDLDLVVHFGCLKPVSKSKRQKSKCRKRSRRSKKGRTSSKGSRSRSYCRRKSRSSPKGSRSRHFQRELRKYSTGDNYIPPTKHHAKKRLRCGGRV